MRCHSSNISETKLNIQLSNIFRNREGRGFGGRGFGDRDRDRERDPPPREGNYSVVV